MTSLYIWKPDYLILMRRRSKIQSSQRSIIVHCYVSLEIQYYTFDIITRSLLPCLWLRVKELTALPNPLHVHAFYC